jgi:hypothetical protein
MGTQKLPFDKLRVSSASGDGCYLNYIPFVLSPSTLLRRALSKHLLETNSEIPRAHHQ